MKVAHLLTGGALQAGLLWIPTAAFANDGDAAQSAQADIIVTAQRKEERLQDVPISITVFSQEQLSNNNIVSSRDLAAYTPGLTVSTRYGNDATTFTVRGFSQELRTTSTVATYFADVVAPRGSGVNTGGDGAGPGQLFDLENLQVLKGPQGTLFGRNTTGGAVLLVPRKPTDEWEGYVEAGVGNFDQRRFQGVINAPFGDTFRMRLGVDRMVRDGYLKNASPIGPSDLANIDYWSVRLSAVADLTPDLENYTIVSFSTSQNNGSIPVVRRCDSSKLASGITTGAYACQQIARLSGKGFWAVENSLPDSRSDQEQWQVINRTTWQASDNLTIKNIFSYAEFRGVGNIDLYGAYFPIGSGPVTSASQVISYVPIHAEQSSGLTNAQASMVEELQAQGQTANGALTWQAGLYYESNTPLGASGVQNPQYTPCADITTVDCAAAAPGASLGVVSWSRYRTTFRSMAAYAQASYKLTDSLTLTAGARYTADRVSSKFQLGTIRIPAAPAESYSTCSNPTAPGFGGRVPVQDRLTSCLQQDSNSTEAPTWQLSLEFKPVRDVMVYAKYVRGYRQGGVAPASPDGLRRYDAEKVDTYEAGVKSSWRGAVPGSLSVSAFYNNFSDQQLQVGMQCPAPCTPTTAIVNAGKSRIYGLEADLSIRPFAGLKMDVSYGYLNSKLQQYTPLVTPQPYVAIPITVGGPLPFSMPHKLTASANYTFPLPETIGKISIGGTFIYQSRYKVGSTATPANGYLPGYTFGNINLSWESVVGLPLDISAFVSNVTNRKMYTNVNDQMRTGFLSYSLAEPRMYGMRARYRF